MDIMLLTTEPQATQDEAVTDIVFRDRTDYPAEQTMVVEVEVAPIPQNHKAADLADLVW